MGAKRPLLDAWGATTGATWWRQRRERQRWYRKWVTRGDLCFDVGANVGVWSDVFLTLGARVVAVEPQASLHDALGRRTAYAQRRMTRVEAAVGAEVGRGVLRCAPEAPQVASLDAAWIEAVQASGRFEDVAWSTSCEVDVTTLDQLVERYGRPAFCKVDVEGHEPDVFAGLSQPLPALSFEWTPEYEGHVERCVESLERLAAYQYQLHVHGASDFAWPTSCGATQLIGRLSALASGRHVGGDIYGSTSAFHRS